MVFPNFMDMVGDTPVVPCQAPDDLPIETYIKLEGANPTGSVKDRACLAIIQDKLARGELVEGKTILDASSGSFACATAYFGNLLGFPVTVVTGTKMTEEKAAFVRYYGAELISHGNFTIDGNRYCQEVLIPKAPEKYCFLDQLHNWINPETHYRTTGPEIQRDLPDVSAVVFSIGSGGTLNGVCRFFRENMPDTKLVGVTAAAGTKIPGTGAFVDGDYITPFIGELFDKQILDYKAEVAIEDAHKRLLALRRQGFFVGVQTGGVYQGMVDAVGELGVKGKVLMISGDAGWKDMGKLLSIA